MADKLTSRVIAALMVGFLAFVGALFLSVVERYLFGSRNVAVALGYLGLMPFCEWLYETALRIWPG